ncbi:hypothetical protein SERLA73DRAFT_176077 [Serpula lacrymans var. lacrymans S7.3]|uniref:C2H2-type domain-containing protein n=2 Tax=Serpula lacrymans var. lacrymans TaxID=341189 RepID=F8PMA0_SERL3|nr:uncharacterized protein SERLADRAFT_458821 [Serpula lacrymans var. lacrymans S7.9]EGO02732.1 hypothetical protein SERLA73DRAFT_176077 [Serpula lacrymans var. lacrymans S7.3]EGO28432.1 hypothetical protein SERLADRAFT_458821 [Serpula lacrymans var. lacrymans S7.9]
MSDPQTNIYTPPFEAYNAEYAKQQQQGLDFISFHSPSDILAPHPDLFELELDSSLAAFNEVQLQLLTVDSNDAYTFLRSDTPTCGPPSTITVSSESAYDSLSSHSESFYNYPSSPYSSTNYSFPLDLEMDFQRIRVEGGVSDYGGVSVTPPTSGARPITVDPNSFSALPPTPSPQPPLSVPAAESAFDQSTFSDFAETNARVNSSASPDYYAQLGYNVGVSNQTTISPSNVSQFPVASVPQTRTRPVEDDIKDDPRKRYKCVSCPRAFARAYNLKTHMATHDPNRLKPHVCPHRSCGRSFSRKHDLGRHLVSIHRDESVCSAHSSASKKSVGVDKGPRGWCNSCGKGWVGRPTECSCADIK